MTETTTTEQKARESKAYFETAIDNVFDIIHLDIRHGDWFAEYSSEHIATRTPNTYTVNMLG